MILGCRSGGTSLPEQPDVKSGAAMADEFWTSDFGPDLLAGLRPEQSIEAGAGRHRAGKKARVGDVALGSGFRCPNAALETTGRKSAVVQRAISTNIIKGEVATFEPAFDELRATEGCARKRAIDEAYIGQECAIEQTPIEATSRQRAGL